MRLRTRQPGPGPRRLWADVAWPVLAGAAGATGAVGAFRASSVVGILATLALLAALTAACLFCIGLEVAPSALEAARWSVAVPTGIMAVWGLVHALDLVGFLVVVLVAATSPPVVRRASSRLARAAGAPDARRGGPGGRTAHDQLDRDLVDRRFEEMVAGLDDPGDAQER